MIDALPVDLDDCSFSGINFYFNLHSKDTGNKVDLMNENGECVTGFTYGKSQRQTKRKKHKSEYGNVINFNPNKMVENN